MYPITTLRIARVNTTTVAVTTTGCYTIVLYKYTISKLFIESTENKLNSAENPSNSNELRSKCVRKVSQNVQFAIYQDETCSQMNPIRPEIVVELPFQSGIHYKRGPLYLSESLHLNPANRGLKAKSIPKK